MDSSGDALVQPSLVKGWNIFSSRPISLVTTLILAVCLCVISFFLLTFPVVAGYFYAVRESRREEYFIDFGSLSRTVGLFLKGMGKYFIQSYIFGLASLLTIAFFYIVPMLPLMFGGKMGMYVSFVLQIVWIPCFFWAGAVVFYGYPYLIATNDAVGAIRYSFSTGTSRPFLSFWRGFLLLYPFPGWIITFLMVLSYPIITAWAVSTARDAPEGVVDMPENQRVTLAKISLTLCLAGIMVAIILGLSWLWGGTGLFIGIGICVVLALLFVHRISR